MNSFGIKKKYQLNKKKSKIFQKLVFFLKGKGLKIYDKHRKEIHLKVGFSHFN